ncbi:hypothetical protein TVAG_413220 [Trichomonas vaginalis G3]|uniref:Uncharacterized protein n=1 Tax=Trichomonas vaginalis (strain ATCC PRA-98 / G3) TaxID=412133 RepID=A2G3W8_TRIV3|nr:hypothetical protein TVAGG3_0113520 [Trichomonas vaginalis G3]EAX88142.1 hypothetical protein TVAG_413220 [Trichomonas vaginalis G3]KAI5545068.1 hypothetical protein TVAGG3_0113520 [Trichomonas vaginalis G3]|eukprot:XP_001301072.1 hypothetical protein [Trichomonas vaginalis G3]
MRTSMSDVTEGSNMNKGTIIIPTKEKTFGKPTFLDGITKRLINQIEGPRPQTARRTSGGLYFVHIDLDDIPEEKRENIKRRLQMMDKIIKN